MRVITLARNPLTYSTPLNCAYLGTGCLAIDPCRVETQDIIAIKNGAGMLLSHIQRGKPGDGSTYEQHSHGRWPSNVILAHPERCVYGYCIPGCPVAWMDSESIKAGVHSAGNKKNAKLTKQTMFHFRPFDHNPDYYQDRGGAARFFKCIKEDGMMKIPQELLDYLLKLISTPDWPALYVTDISEWPVGERPDNSWPGIVAVGQPTDEQAVDIKRVLMPGAHLLLIAPEDEPTGHTGTCRIEDAGFEIRDAILWVREAGRFHYVPKASRSEREAGCAAVEPQKRDDGRQDGSPGGTNPRNRGAHQVHNFHPTIKPFKLMERLLTDVPMDNGPVLDPFMGSGSTGIACLHTGHDFVGVDREKDYIGIATSRIRYWDGEQGYISRVIESDYQSEQDELEPIDLWGGENAE